VNDIHKKAFMRLHKKVQNKRNMEREDILIWEGNE